MTRYSLAATALGFVGGCLVTLGAAGLMATNRPVVASVLMLVAGAALAIAAVLMAESAESERAGLSRDLEAARGRAARGWDNAREWASIARQVRAHRDYHIDLLRQVVEAAPADLAPPLRGVVRTVRLLFALDPDDLQACPGGAYLTEPDVQDEDEREVTP